MRTIIRNNYDPKTSDYHETLVIDDEREKKYLFDCDGVFTDITAPKVVSEPGDSEDYAASQKWVTEVQGDLADETQNRIDADGAIWTEIENIEAASDVVDVVGTYAELEAYDTSKLHDNDLIKVLQDETHDNEIAYYRWSTSTEAFSYVGAEGPYYTQSQIDVMMSGKQDTLIAGTNIQIAADGVTISATDTTYTPFTGATASTAGAAGLVPAPAAGEQNKVLKGDGTWGNENEVTIFYVNQFSSTTGNITFYKDENRTIAYTYKEVEEAIESGATEVRAHWTSGAENVYDAVFTPLSLYVKRDTTNPGVYADYRLYFKGNYTAQNDYKLVIYLFIPMSSPETNTAVFNPAYTEFITANDYATTTKYGIVKIGDNLTTDANNKLIAKTMTGATSGTAGTVGVVPAPAAGDEGKFLKGDGTWGEVSTTTVFYEKIVSSTQTLYKDSALTTTATYEEFVAALNKGPVKIINTGAELGYSVTVYVVSDNGNNYTITYQTSVYGTYRSYEYSVIAGLKNDPAVFSRAALEYNLPTASSNTKGGIKVGNTLSISSQVLDAKTMVGATSGVNGAAGYVPAPTTSDVDNFLKGDGTWSALPGANNISSADWSTLWL